MHDKWCTEAQFEAGWDHEVSLFRNQQYLTEPVMGRRRDFLDGENVNEIVNYPIQATGAALMNKAIVLLSDLIPLHKWGVGTGITNQCHDSIVIECPSGTRRVGSRATGRVYEPNPPCFPRYGLLCIGRYRASLERGMIFKLTTFFYVIIVR